MRNTSPETPGAPEAVAVPAGLDDRISAVEKVLTNIAGTLVERRKINEGPPADASWLAASDPSTSAASPVNMVRVDSLPQFPKNVPHGMIWETFTAYIEKFNLSLSLYRVNDSAQKAKLLYLAVGDDLQEIVRTNGLRPSLDDPECYETMIKNIAAYFRSMTDASAEHDAFGEMKQGPEEPVMKFVARLRSKVTACGYHAGDEERFVRSQFFKGNDRSRFGRTRKNPQPRTGGTGQQRTPRRKPCQQEARSIGQGSTSKRCADAGIVCCRISGGFLSFTGAELQRTLERLQRARANISRIREELR